jgi:hypothetical protein
MRYLVLLKAAQPDTPPPPALMEAIMKLGAEATESGSLAPSAAGARVSLSADDLTVTDGPFAESKEMISYALYEVRAKEEAVEWASRFMRVHKELWPGWEGTSDVIKVMGPVDFAPPA